MLINHSFFFTGRVSGIGRIGVNLFFFISGILVYRSLAKDGDRMRLVFSFWHRRILRLVPALLIYLVVMALVVVSITPHPGIPDGPGIAYYLQLLPFSAFFAADYAREPLSMGHLWSVAVEMQFYILAPALFVLIAPRWRIPVWTAILAGLVICGASVIFNSLHEKYQFQMTVWPMMLGLLTEHLKGAVTAAAGRWSPRLITAGIVAVVAAVALMTLGYGKGIVVALGSVVFVPCFLSYATGRSAPGLFGHALQFLGQRTYSIYLWQQPFTIAGFIPVPAHPIGALISIAVGALSFHYFELPFLSQKRRTKA